MENLRGNEREHELMGMPRDKPRGDFQDGMYKPNSRIIAEDLVKSHNEGKVVYCRFGKQYILNLEKQLNLVLSGTT